MKHLFIIFTLLLTSVSWSKDVDFFDLVERDGLYYEKFTDVPFSGNVVGRLVGKIKNGIWDGEIVEYYENGQLSRKTNYKDGKKEGESLWYYANGQLWIKSNFKDGKPEGEHLEYDKNGKLKITEIYKDNKIIETINH